MLFCNTCIFQNAMKVQMESMRKGSEVEKAWEGENLVWRWKTRKDYVHSWKNYYTGVTLVRKGVAVCSYD